MASIRVRDAAPEQEKQWEMPPFWREKGERYLFQKYLSLFIQLIMWTLVQKSETVRLKKSFLVGAESNRKSIILIN